MSIPDGAWFGIRDAARRCEWEEVATRAEALGWPIVARHARRASFDFDSLKAVVFGLLLDQPDEPGPFGDERQHADA